MVKLDLNKIKAVIFDMDGTMIDNAIYHKQAWQELCTRHGFSLTDKEYKTKISGRKNNQILALFFDKQLTKAEIEQYAEEKEQIYRDIYESDIQEVAGLTTSIQKLTSKGIKLAVATTAPAKNREFVLNKLGLTDSFRVILGDEHVTQGKPDPEIYLSAIKALNTDPSEVVVFEDSPSGVSAGKNAGLKVIAVLTTHSKEELSNADEFVNDFNDVKILS